MLYAPANITADETKIIKFELFKFFQYWIKRQENSNLHNLESQFIAIDKHDLPCEDQAPVLYDVLRRMQIDDAWSILAFIVVGGNKEFPIHIDDHAEAWTTLGLNIPVFNCNNTKTVWYDTIPEENHDMPDYISALTPHAGVVSTKCVATNAKEIGSVDANVPHWVDVSVPHAPVCNHSKLRINSSLRFKFDTDNFFTDPKFSNCMIKKLP
jgi:hypothetical protein